MTAPRRDSSAKGRGQRGSVLLLVTILLAVLMIGGAALMYRGSVERSAAFAQTEFDGASTCARAAYGVLWTDFLASGADPYTAMPKMLIPDPNRLGQANNMIQLDLGHFDQTSLNTNDIKVRLDSSTLSSNTAGPTESTNSFRESLGGDPYRFVAHCKYPSGAEYELEFVVRLGL